MRRYMTRYCDLTPTTSWPDPAASWSSSMAVRRPTRRRRRGLLLAADEVRRVRRKVKTAARAREIGEPGARLEEDVRAVH
jgi:hypothetical protein